jgi:hypothetical protein
MIRISRLSFDGMLQDREGGLVSAAGTLAHSTLGSRARFADAWLPAMPSLISKAAFPRQRTSLTALEKISNQNGSV